jgi:crotonobetainyl-CoA:carnitine CoA-transferase CaiB-like acyl-CoA transferase
MSLFCPPFYTPRSLLVKWQAKKSICLDLHQADDREVAHHLMHQSDIVVENFRSGVMERFGLGYEAWCQDHPGLIYCSISGYGRTGPYKDRAGYDVMVSALGGLMSITGQPGGEPIKTGVALTDVVTGLNAFSAILAALYHRERTGQGQRVDVSRIRLSAHPEWATDARYLSNARRVQNREPLLAQIEAIIQTDTVPHWESLLAAVGVAVAPVNRMDQVFRDPQVIASQQVVTIPHPEIGEVKMVGPAVTYSLTPAQVITPPPGLGEQTAEIIRGLSER